MNIANSAMSASFTAVGLKIGTTASGIATTTAGHYGIKGVGYLKAITATAAITAAPTQAAQTTCVYLIQLDAAGVFSSVKGEEVANALVGSAAYPGQNSVQIPHAEDGKAPIGMVIITTLNAATFTAGTTLLSAADVKDTFQDFIGGIPSDPQIIQSV